MSNKYETYKHITLECGKKLIIRAAVIGDTENMIQFFEEAYGETSYLKYELCEYKNSIEIEREKLNRIIESDYCYCLISCVSNKIVGMITVERGTQKKIRHAGEIGVAILKEYWGMGIATLLFNQLEERLGEYGRITKLNLRVRTDNDRAVSLYKKWGFIIEGKIRNEVLIRGNYYDIYWMGKVFYRL